VLSPAAWRVTVVRTVRLSKHSNCSGRSRRVARVLRSLRKPRSIHLDNAAKRTPGMTRSQTRGAQTRMSCPTVAKLTHNTDYTACIRAFRCLNLTKDLQLHANSRQPAAKSGPWPRGGAVLY